MSFSHTQNRDERGRFASVNGSGKKPPTTRETPQSPTAPSTETNNITGEKTVPNAWKWYSEICGTALGPKGDPDEMFKQLGWPTVSDSSQADDSFFDEMESPPDLLSTIDSMSDEELDRVYNS